jgi:hypothetical protein
MRGASGEAAPFVAVTALAEGADRLVTDEILRLPGAELDVVLPLPRERYVEDFATARSRDEFESLLARARRCTQLPPAPTREESYERAGEEILDRSDLLVAIWDGRPAGGRGGTGAVVERARHRNPPVPVCTIDPVSSRVEIDELETVAAVVRQLAAYNGHKVQEGEFDDRSIRRIDTLGRAFSSLESRRRALPFLEWQVPFFLRADLLARRYQQVHMLLSSAVFYLASAALIVAAVQILFAPAVPGFQWIEASLLLILLGLLVAGRWRNVHERWISYRFLAERLRTALFTAFCGVEASRSAVSERIVRVTDSERWLKKAFGEIWSVRPGWEGLGWTVSDAKALVMQGWIEEQVQYFRSTASRFRRRVHRLGLASYALFLLTIVAATLHSLDVAEEHSWGRLIALATIAFPAVGVALSGVRTHREYVRNSDRSETLEGHLLATGVALHPTSDPKTLRRLVSELDAVMHEENRDWFLLMLHHEIEPPG